MPSEKDHLDKATRNTTFFELLCSSHPEFTDWIVVAIFYTALHFVDAFLARRGIHPGDHAMRDMEVSKHLRPHYRIYRALKNDCIEARYDTLTFGPSDIVKSRQRLADIITGTKPA